jgi:hypothetical protein
MIERLKMRVSGGGITGDEFIYADVVLASEYDKEHAIAEAAREFCAKCPGFSGTEIGKLYDLCFPASGGADGG